MSKTIVSTELAELCIEKTGLFKFLSLYGNLLDLTKDKKNQSIGISKIYTDAFKCVSGIDRIILPCELTVIQEFAFDNCNDLRIIDYDSTNGAISSEENSILSKTNLIIQSNGFSCCQNLESIHIKCNKLSLEKDAFANCRNLKNIIIQCNELDFRTGAFSNAKNLTIYGNKTCKSYLEKYCNSNNINFIEVN